jgi:hypothetical protein
MSGIFGSTYCSQACRYVPKDRQKRLRGLAVEKHWSKGKVGFGAGMPPDLTLSGQLIIFG